MAMIDIQCSEEIKSACPDFKGMALEATVTNTSYSEELWQEIAKFSDEYRARYTVDSIKEMPSIQATRMAYKIRAAIVRLVKLFAVVYCADLNCTKWIRWLI